MDKPSVGRIVHYVSNSQRWGGEGARYCRAAIITETFDGVERIQELLGAEKESVFKPNTVNLAVLEPDCLRFESEVQYGEPGTCEKLDLRTWHWPERTGGIVTQTVVLGTDGIEHIVPLKGR